MTLWSTALSDSRRQRILVVALSSCLLLLSSLTDIRTATKLEATGNLLLGFNLYHHGTLSMDCGETGPVRPTAFRPPAYPALVALGIALDSEVRCWSSRRFRFALEKPFQPLKSLRVLHAILRLMIALLAMALVLAVTKSFPAAVLALLLVGTSPRLGTFISVFRPVILASFLLFLLSASLLLAFERREGRYFVLAGLAQGFLALTRVVHGYLLLPTVVLGLFWAWRDNRHRREVIRGTALFAITSLIVIGGWLARNHHHFGRILLSERGGIVLNTRAEYDRMSLQEWGAAFLYWGPRVLRERLLPSLLPFDAYRRLDRSQADGYYQKAWARQKELYREMGDHVLADSRMKEEALRKIAAAPFRHLLVSLPIAYRGLFVEGGPSILKPILLLSFFGLALLGCRGGHGKYLAFCLPSLLNIAFHCLTTHGDPRYNYPLIPVFWASTVLFAWLTWGPWLYARLTSGRSSAPGQ